MELDAPSLWWLTVGLFVAAELATGTFYLLMLAAGSCAGALAAYAGVDPKLQVVTASVVGGGAVVVWHLLRQRRPATAPAESNRDVNIDIGQRLNVPAWGTDGAARVQYRGANWSVRFAGSGQPVPGEHVIVALKGSELQVAPATPH